MIPATAYKDFDKIVELKRICAEELSVIDWNELAEYLLAQPKDPVKNDAPSWMIHWCNGEQGPVAVEDSENERRQDIPVLPDGLSTWLFLNFIDHCQPKHTDSLRINSAFKNTIEYINQLSGVLHAGLHFIGSEFLIPTHTDPNGIYSMILTFKISNHDPENVKIYISNKEFNFKDQEYFMFVPEIEHSVLNASDNDWINLVLRIYQTEFRN